MLQALARHLGLELHSESIPVGEGARVELDGVSDDRSVLVESCAHHGVVKPAQRNKVLADAMKLVLVEAILGHRARKILLFSDVRAAQRFRSGWAAVALAHFAVEVVVVEISQELRASILEAQVRQYR
jgi:hypothetical protein